ncbi:DUF397 domain-containing protein [Streptomyces griseoviridis]|uniref:DUF397 domain-containing protein n=1 Tax=Streptomyces griseoviridis TaxID=45398 RepID=UPI003409F091
MNRGVENFRKSSHSSQEGNCVEVADSVGDGRAAIRDSKHPDGPLLTLSVETWRRFLRAV